VFLEALRACGALAAIAPEVDALYGVPQPPAHHPEIDTGVHTGMVVDQAALLAPGNLEVAYAALVHDLGKGLTPREQWPQHVDHESNGQAPVRILSARWKVPTSCRDLGVSVCVYHLHSHRALEMRPGKLRDLMEKIGVLRQPEKLEPFLLACLADARGRTGFEDRPYPQADYLRQVAAAALSVTAAQALAAGKQGPEIGQAMHTQRLRAISAVRSVTRAKTKEKERAAQQEPALPRAKTP
jgi:tRNA nucleotidyltransferase (CCA-adding enzyme)